MPVTLAQAKLNTQDDLDRIVIDEFRKSSVILDMLQFHDAVNPMGGGSTLTYGYHRLVTERGAAFRAINNEYGKAEATKQRFTVDLKPLGGAFDIDRVLAGIARGEEVDFQMGQLIKATRTKFQDEVVNGDVAVDVNGFDGLDKSLTGSTTEFRPTTATDISNLAPESTEVHQFLDALDEWLGLLDGTPTAILGNKKAIAKVRGAARRAGYYSRDRDDFGRTIERYNGIPLLDPGDKENSTNPIIPIETRDLDGGGANPAIEGLTDLYAVRFGMDGFHGVTVSGQQMVNVWLPDFDTAGAVKTGEAEVGPVAVALKATKSAAVFRNLKVQ
jgi:hypothetical protein